MALSIGVKVNDRIYLGDHSLDVRRATKGSVVGKFDGRLVEIAEGAFVELAPSILVRCSNSVNPYPRLDFDAPKLVKISLYRRDRSLNLQRRLAGC